MARDQRWKTHVIDAWALHQVTLEAALREEPSFDLILDGLDSPEENLEKICHGLAFKQDNGMTTNEDLYLIADELRAIASNGLKFAEIGYDRERYEQVLKASARLVAAMERSSVDEVYAQYADNLAHLSPVLCIDAAVFHEGKILLIQRRDDHRWAMPGGMVEVGESAAEAAERELWEEAGVHGKAIRVLGVYDSRFWPTKSRMQLCIVQFLMQTEDLPTVHPESAEGLSSYAETLDVGYFEEDHLPGLHVGQDQRIPMAYKLFRGEADAPFFDR